MTTFIHTADWQLGKPFAGIDDIAKRALVQQERIGVITRIGAVAREQQASFVLIAGDLFDSPSVTKATVSAACSAIGALKLPVIAIPGNHDHGGPGSIWEQPFFERERAQLAPNLRVLHEPTPVELDDAVIFPCPLLRRHEPTDLTSWLRSFDSSAAQFGNKPRIVLAHGSVQGFGSQSDDEEGGGDIANFLDVARLPSDAYDYIALGDWHGTKQIGPRAWYAGTPELDRFPKGEDHAPGNVLVVSATRAQLPTVQSVPVARFGWHPVSFTFTDDASLAILEHQIAALVGLRAQEDLVRLELTGSLGIEATSRLEELIESWRARLLRLKLANRAVIAPSATELQSLVQRAGDPLISRVASALVARASGDTTDAAVARLALRELHAACTAR